MDPVRTKLRRLRNWFTAWFVVEAVAGTAAAAYVLEGMRYLPWPRHMGAASTVEFTVGAGILVSAVLLFLALLVFDALLDFSPWARLVLLVLGWLTVGSALLNLLLFRSSSALLGSLAGFGGAPGSALTAASLLSDAVNLLFWVWVIHTLQFDREVRDVFLAPKAESGS